MNMRVLPQVALFGLVFLGLSAADATEVRGAPVGVVARSTGPVHAVRGKMEVPLRVGDSVLVGDTLRTGKGGSVQVHFLDESIAKLKENTRVRVVAKAVSQAAGRTLLHLEAGAFRARVPELGNDTDYRLSSPAGVVALQGTETIVYFDRQANALRVAQVESDAIVALGDMDGGMEAASRLVNDPEGNVRLPAGYEVGLSIDGLIDKTPAQFDAEARVFLGTEIQPVPEEDLIKLMGPLIELLRMEYPALASRVIPGPTINEAVDDTNGLDETGEGAEDAEDNEEPDGSGQADLDELDDVEPDLTDDGIDVGDAIEPIVSP